MERLTRRQFRERFANTKIYIRDNCFQVQRLLFKGGVTWKNGDSDVRCTDRPFLYIDGDGRLLWGGDLNMIVPSDFRESSIEEVENIELIEDEKVQ